MYGSAKPTNYEIYQGQGVLSLRTFKSDTFLVVSFGNVTILTHCFRYSERSSNCVVPLSIARRITIALYAVSRISHLTKKDPSQKAVGLADHTLSYGSGRL